MLKGGAGTTLLAKLSNLSLKSINCDVDNKKEIKLINKHLNKFSNTKIKLDFIIPENTSCKSVNIIDEKYNQNYLVKIDQLNSFHTIFFLL